MPMGHRIDPLLADGRSTVTATCDIDGAVIVVAPHGGWNWRLYLDLYTAMHKYLAEHPVALIVDLYDLTDPPLPARRCG